MRYIEKDKMWYVKSICDVIMIAIFMICLIGFVITFVISLSYRIIAGNPIAVVVSNTMGWFMGIGLMNFLIMISYDSDWRRDYER